MVSVMCMCDTPEASSFVQLCDILPQSPSCIEMNFTLCQCRAWGPPTALCVVSHLSVHHSQVMQQGLCTWNSVTQKLYCVKIAPPGTLGCKMCTGLTKLSLSRCRFMLCVGNVCGTYSVIGHLSA